MNRVAHYVMIQCLHCMNFLRGFVAVLFLTVLYVLPVHAQDNAGITLIPTFIDNDGPVNPGEILSRTLTVTNESATDKEYYVYKKNIKGVGDGGVPLFAEEGAEVTGFELSEWIELPVEQPLAVPAYGSREIPITIRVPENATPGSHFGGIFVSVEAPKLRQTGAGVGYEVASIVHFRISGDIVDTARIRSLSTDKLLYGSKNVKFTAKIENQGNILIQPRGPITITSMFSAEPDVFTINENLAGVFPGTMRDIDFEWNSDGLGFGRYEAILALVYDGAFGQKTIDASVVFWVFPIKIMLIIFGVVVGIAVAGYAFTRYYINQAILRAGGGRRIVPQRYRAQVGISRFAFIFTMLMAVLVLFLLVLLIFSA